MLKALFLAAIVAASVAPVAFAAQSPPDAAGTKQPVPPTANMAPPGAPRPVAAPPTAAPNLPTPPVPAAKDAPSAPSADICPVIGASGALVDINAAGVDELDTLSGIGPARAAAIIDERKKGFFEHPEDLVKRGVLPQGAFDCLKARVVLANANLSSADAMQAVLPGVGAARAKAIVEGRKKGPYKSLADLGSRIGLPQPTIDGLKGLLAF